MVVLKIELERDGECVCVALGPPGDMLWFHVKLFLISAGAAQSSSRNNNNTHKHHWPLESNSK